MILLHPYTPDPATAARQRATWDALADGARWLRRRGWTVYHVPCTTHTTYDTAVRAVWGRDDLCILEHDMEATPAQWGTLAACPHPICVWAYPLAIPQDRTDLMRWVVAFFASQPSATRAAWLAAHDPLVTAHVWLQALDAGETTTWVHRIATPEAELPWRWIRTGERWADYWGLGLTRIRREAQEQVRDWPPGTWRNLDDRLSRACRAQGIRAHVHWPAVAHHHEAAAPRMAGA